MTKVADPMTVCTFRAMASDVHITLIGPGEAAAQALLDAQAVFQEVEAACTRFDPASPLMRANADPARWHAVPRRCLDAVAEAFEAHVLTDGMFDPRVLASLQTWGYDTSLPFEAGQVSLAAAAGRVRGADAPWRPEFDLDRMSLRLGDTPIDLGGIGKGLAVRWASERLRGAAAAALVDAGGDCYAHGAGPDGSGWLVGVEDPLGGAEPVVVLGLTDVACATSSIRLRRWRVAGQEVHHLVDPRTGLPGGEGLVAVTVVDDDPARAEVWAKTLFLQGRAGIGEAAGRRGLAALWISEDGRVELSPPMAAHVRWEQAR